MRLCPAVSKCVCFRKVINVQQLQVSMTLACAPCDLPAQANVQLINNLTTRHTAKCIDVEMVNSDPWLGSCRLATQDGHQLAQLGLKCHMSHGHCCFVAKPVAGTWSVDRKCRAQIRGCDWISSIVLTAIRPEAESCGLLHWSRQIISVSGA